MCGVVQSQVDAGVHVQSYIDHLAPVCDTRILVSGAVCNNPKCRVRIDEAALLDPGNKRGFQEIGSSISDVSWHISAHTHAATLVTHLQQELGATFPLPPGTRAHHFLFEGSMEIRAKLKASHRALPP